MSRRALLTGGVAVTAGTVGAGLGVAQGELSGRPWLQARLGLNGEAGLAVVRRRSPDRAGVVSGP